MTLKVGIARFLGTNCDQDIMKWMNLNSHKAEYLWYEDQFNTADYDLVIIPGGFSYGDYLRCGALAARTPVMRSIRDFAAKEKPILGICNGFQILCEAGLLPGVLLRNKSLKFKDEWTDLIVRSNKAGFLKDISVGSKIKLPIAHGDGQYFADSDTLKQLQDQDQIWLSYVKNPNGSVMDIAGITNKRGNICGLMPHPERALVQWMGSSDGACFL